MAARVPDLRAPHEALSQPRTTTPKETAVTRSALDVGCPYCAAAAGHCCRTTGGAPRPVHAARKPAVPSPTTASDTWTIGMCANATIVYRPGTTDIDHLTYCRQPGTVARWSRPGTDGARLQHYCPEHIARIAVFEQNLNARLDQARAERGEEPLVWHLWARVGTPDGPGHVVFLPSATSSDTYAVGLDSRRRGDRPRQYVAHQLTALQALTAR
jgi:hypothetical protein